MIIIFNILFLKCKLNLVSIKKIYFILVTGPRVKWCLYLITTFHENITYENNVSILTNKTKTYIFTLLRTM